LATAAQAFLCYMVATRIREASSKSAGKVRVLVNVAQLSFTYHGATIRG
jgi:hypothetical protein